MAEPDHSPKRSSPLFNVTIYAGLLFGIAQVIYFDVNPDSPLRGGGPGREIQEQNEQILARFSKGAIDAAGGRSMALHVSIPPAVLGTGQNVDTDHGKLVAGLYFYTAYVLYPRRVYVGEDDQIVNAGRQLPGPPPSPQWLGDHGVAHVLELGEDSTGHMTKVMVPVQ